MKTVMAKEIDYTDLAEKVYAHAQKHYNEGGWDMVVEAMEIREIAAELREDGIRTLAQAIKQIGGGCKVAREHEDEMRKIARW